MESNVEKAYDAVDKWLNDHKEKGGILHRIAEKASVEGIALQIIHENNLVIYLKPESKNSWIVLSPEGIKVTETKGGIRKYLKKKNSTSFKEGVKEFKKGFWNESGKYSFRGVLLALALSTAYLGWDRCNTKKEIAPKESQAKMKQPFAKKKYDISNHYSIKNSSAFYELESKP